MNKDQVKGSIKETTGKAQQQLGKAVGSEKQQLKGAAREVEGRGQKAYGNAKERLRDDMDD